VTHGECDGQADAEPVLDELEGQYTNGVSPFGAAESGNTTICMNR
jgi:hypothetical protein